MTAERFEQLIESLKGMSYSEWFQLRMIVDKSFEKQIGESKRTLQLADAENLEEIRRLEFG